MFMDFRLTLSLFFSQVTKPKKGWCYTTKKNFVDVICSFGPKYQETKTEKSINWVAKRWEFTLIETIANFMIF